MIPVIASLCSELCRQKKPRSSMTDLASQRGKGQARLARTDSGSYDYLASAQLPLREFCNWKLMTDRQASEAPFGGIVKGASCRLRRGRFMSSHQWWCSIA